MKFCCVSGEWKEHFHKSKEWQAQHEQLKMKDSSQQNSRPEDNTVTQSDSELFQDLRID